MEYLVICVVALIGSGLTLFSGFGLGTILVPVFAIFFPVDIAIALTAIVHFLNNLFKLALLGKFADKSIILRFGIPSILFAFIGALTLNAITHLSYIAQYSIAGKEFIITPVKLTIGILILFFALYDLFPRLYKINFNKDLLVFGGMLSGFFGGLSGNQGALRSTFLSKLGLTKETFIATGVVIACLTDVSRLAVYFRNISKIHDQINILLIAAATLSAFAGAYAGNKVMKKVTISSFHIIIGIMLICFAVFFGMGII